MKNIRYYGFTLIELSMVILVIGLIVGGTVVGIHLISAAKLRGILTEQEQYATAVAAFKNKYRQLPGDMSRPAQFFGSEFFYDIQGNGDVFGDNNGVISVGESSFAWKQLFLAGLSDRDVADMYNYLTFDNGYWSLRTAMHANSAPSRYEQNAIWVFGRRHRTSSTTLFFGTRFGGQLPVGGVIKDIDLMGMDSKMDDGNPQKGLITLVNDDEVSGAEKGCYDEVTGNYTGTGQKLCSFEKLLGF